MWTCCRPASSTVESSPSCCPRFRGSGGDRSRSLRRSAGAPWWAVLWSSAPKPTPRSAAALRPACRRALPRRSSASAAARRSRQACSTASLFLPCTRVDLQQHTHTNTSQVPDVHWSPSQLLWKPFIKLLSVAYLWLRIYPLQEPSIRHRESGRQTVRKPKTDPQLKQGYMSLCCCAFSVSAYL